MRETDTVADTVVAWINIHHLLSRRVVDGGTLRRQRLLGSSPWQGLEEVPGLQGGQKHAG